MSKNDPERRAVSEPNFDFFAQTELYAPKSVIGRYVASQGIPVPLLDDPQDWRNALRDGTAMFRSEMPQDYEGFSGVLDSPRIVAEDGELPVRDSSYEILLGTETLKKVKAEIFTQMTEGNGVPTGYDLEYARKFLWQDQINRMLSDIASSGIDDDALRSLVKNLGFMNLGISRWRYIEGTNITVMGDTAITGKYRIGVEGPSSGSWSLDNSNSDLKLVGRVPNGRDVDEIIEHAPTAGEVIDLYERVRQLPYFDQRQIPVMEMQHGVDGVLHFLQYLKTGHIFNDPGEFPLPNDDNTIQLTTSLRGATSKEGETIRLYLGRGWSNPYHSDMKNQGIFDNVHQSMDLQYAVGGGSFNGIQNQMAMMAVKVYVGDLYTMAIGSHHQAISGLIRPDVAIGMSGSTLRTPKSDKDAALYKKLLGLSNEATRLAQAGKRPYILSTVTSNGRNATLGSDWELRT